MSSKESQRITKNLEKFYQVPRRFVNHLLTIPETVTSANHIKNDLKNFYEDSPKIPETAAIENDMEKASRKILQRSPRFAEVRPRFPKDSSITYS